MAWFGPEETDPDRWQGEDKVRRGDDVRSTYERAVAARLPYDRRIEVRGGLDAVEKTYPDSDYDFVRLQSYGAIDSNGRLKLNERALLWGEDEYRRLRRHYRRPAEPSETAPFEGYTRWTREVRGAVKRMEASMEFQDGDRESEEEETITIDWEDSGPFHQIALAELELVRNPPFARHCLRDRDRWEEIDDTFRYLIHAFDSPP